MKLNTLFTTTAVVLVFFGAGFVLIPTTVFSLYSISLTDSGIMLANVAGAAVFALGLLAWLFRNSSDSDASRSAATALLGFFVIKSIVTIVAQLGGVFNALGWSIVALDVILTIAYAYFLFVGRSAVAPAQ